MICDIEFSLSESLNALWLPILMREMDRHQVYPFLCQIIIELNVYVPLQRETKLAEKHLSG